MICDNLKIVRERIHAACDRSGRNPGEVRIMAVTKTVAVDYIREALDLGITFFGENKVQEGRDKASCGTFSGATLCMIGHLQTNKASIAARTFDEVHSVDSVRVAEALAKYATTYRNSPVPVYVEVNIGNDPAKHGVPASDALALAQAILSTASLKLRGLMTVAPGYGDPDAARSAFRSLRELRDRMVDSGIERDSVRDLSMGMSGDFDIAVEEGSTVVRLGTALFGPRY